MSSSRIEFSYTCLLDNFRVDIEANFPSKGITAVIGESGSGKTTLLRCIAGLETPQQGFLSVGENIWQDENSSLPTHKRPIGFVFQEASLFEHLTAGGNLQYAIKRAAERPSGDTIDTVVGIMGIADILEKYPNQLSGGERQRVAIARALLIQPKLILMDEPLASLDTRRKQEILPYLEKLHESYDTPIVYVSHAMDEVARLADHVLVMEKGSLVAQGSVKEIFSRLDFPGQLENEAGVILQGKVSEVDTQWHLSKVRVGGDDFWLSDIGKKCGENVRIRIQAKDVSLALSARDDMSILNCLAVQVVEMTGDSDSAGAMLRLKTGDNYLLARVTRKSVAYLNVSEGVKLWAQIKSVAIVR